MVCKRKGTMPKGRISFKKVTGGYAVNIKGKVFNEVTDKGAARDSVKRIQRLREEDEKCKRSKSFSKRIRR